MKLEFKEELPNLINGTINKISTEIDYTVSDITGAVNIDGKILVIREIKNNSRVTEIRDFIPIEITVKKHKLIKRTKGVSLLLEGFQFDFKEDCTILSGDLDLTNVEDDQGEQSGEFELIFEEAEQS